MENKNYTQNNPNNNTKPTSRTGGHIAIPYTLCEKIKNICKKYGIQTHFKSKRTLKNILVTSKEKYNIQQNSFR